MSGGDAGTLQEEVRDGHSRIPGQGHPRALRRAGAQGRACLEPRAGRVPRPRDRRHCMGGEGAGPRGRPRCGGWREGLPQPRRSARLLRQPSGQEPRHQADRRHRQAGVPALGRGRDRHRARTLPRLRARPEIRAHHDRRLRARRHGDRGPRRERSRQPAPHGDRPRRGPCRVPDARACLRARPHRQAGGPDVDHAARLLPRLSRLRCDHGRGEPPRHHRRGRPRGAGRQDELRHQRAVPPAAGGGAARPQPGGPAREHGRRPRPELRGP